MSFFHPRLFNGGNKLMRLGVARFCSGLISLFVFDIFQIPVGCIVPT